MLVEALFPISTQSAVGHGEKKSVDDSANAGEAANKETKAPQLGSNRKTRRKAKLEPMIEPAEIEEGQLFF